MPSAAETSPGRRDCVPMSVADPSNDAERAKIGEQGIAPTRPGTMTCGPPGVAP